MSIPRWVVPAKALIYDMGDEPVVVVLERDYLVEVKAEGIVNHAVGYEQAIDDCLIEAKKLHFHHEGMATCRECGDPDDPCPTVAALEALRGKP